MTSVYLAAVKGHLDCVKRLKDLGAKLDVKAKNGKTPLDVAIENGFTEVADWLCANDILYVYKRLVQEKNTASTENEYLNLAQQFRAMNGYENSAELAKECDSHYCTLKERREKEEKAKEQHRNKTIAISGICGLIFGWITDYRIGGTVDSAIVGTMLSTMLSIIVVAIVVQYEKCKPCS